MVNKCHLGTLKLRKAQIERELDLKWKNGVTTTTHRHWYLYSMEVHTGRTYGLNWKTTIQSSLRAEMKWTSWYLRAKESCFTLSRLTEVSQHFLSMKRTSAETVTDTDASSRRQQKEM
ncbi:hypothetical protein FPOAC2_03640 [Fusarium poae]